MVWKAFWFDSLFEMILELAQKNTHLTWNHFFQKLTKPHKLTQEDCSRYLLDRVLVFRPVLGCFNVTGLFIKFMVLSCGLEAHLFSSYSQQSLKTLDAQLSFLFLVRFTCLYFYFQLSHHICGWSNTVFIGS
jgi:hypothetical protein